MLVYSFISKLELIVSATIQSFFSFGNDIDEENMNDDFKLEEASLNTPFTFQHTNTNME
jgi:hypothetical protein